MEDRRWPWLVSFDVFIAKLCTKRYIQWIKSRSLQLGKVLLQRAPGCQLKSSFGQSYGNNQYPTRKTRRVAFMHGAKDGWFRINPLKKRSNCAGSLMARDNQLWCNDRGNNCVFCFNAGIILNRRRAFHQSTENKQHGDQIQSMRR